jgi:hypothetical protein
MRGIRPDMIYEIPNMKGVGPGIIGNVPIMKGIGPPNMITVEMYLIREELDLT